MAWPAGELSDPVVVLIEDEFSSLSEEERVERTEAWLASLCGGEPVELSVSGADLVHEARAEAGW